VSDFKHVHFIGAGGSGMSGLVLLAHAQGLKVSGSDQKPTKYLEAVLAAGIPVSFEQQAANVADSSIDLVVVSTAVPDDNPELAAARQRGLTIWKRAQMLDWLGRGKRCLAVAGTHGKTTTSSMLASTLDGLFLDPSFLIGGVLAGFGATARSGRGEDYVIEADESDESFVYLHPKLAIITNIEWDHIDHYASLQEVEAAFSRFIQTIDPDGCLVCCADDPVLLAVARSSGRSFVTYGEMAGADYRCLPEAASCFTVCYPDGQRLSVRIDTSPGIHNMLNASAVLAALDLLGLDRSATAAALSGFAGAKRRFELVGEVRQVQVVDDYGHHPTEFKATLAAAQSLGYRRVHLLFQPHRFTRLQGLFNDFVESFDLADSISLLEVYPAGEQPIEGIDSHALASALQERHPKKLVEVFPDPSQAVRALAELAGPDDLVLTMGAGDITQLAPKIVEALASQDGSDSAGLGHLAEVENDVSAHDTSGHLAVRQENPEASPPIAKGGDLSASIFEAYCELEGNIQGSLMLNEPMNRHTSFHIGGPVALLVECASIGDMNESLSVIHKYQLPWTVIGKGSNLLVADAGFMGAVLILGREFKTFHLPHDHPGETLSAMASSHGQRRPPAPDVRSGGGADGSSDGKLVCGAGVLLGNLVQAAFKCGYSGLEFAVGIPGTLGGAVFMNAGSANEWISSTLNAVTVLRPGCGLVRYHACELPWSYRFSGLPPGEVVVEAELLVRKGNLEHIRGKMEALLRKRQKSQPLSLPSAGSVFRNPPDASAGQLIDSLGMKGFAIGDASISEMHANFIVNRGQAKAVDVLALIQEVRRRVKESYGKELSTEIRFIGFS